MINNNHDENAHVRNQYKVKNNNYDNNNKMIEHNNKLIEQL